MCCRRVTKKASQQSCAELELSCAPSPPRRRCNLDSTHLQVSDQHKPMVHNEVRDEVELEEAGESDVSAEKSEKADHGKKSDIRNVNELAVTKFEQGRVGVEICKT